MSLIPTWRTPLKLPPYIVAMHFHSAVTSLKVFPHEFIWVNTGWQHLPFELEYFIIALLRVSIEHGIVFFDYRRQGGDVSYSMGDFRGKSIECRLPKTADHQFSLFRRSRRQHAVKLLRRQRPNIELRIGVAPLRLSMTGIESHQFLLRLGGSLRGGFSVPEHRTFRVFGHAPAIVIAFAQTELCIGTSLFCGLAVPEYRRLIVPRHAEAVDMAHGQTVLRFFQSLRGGLVKPERRRSIVPRHAVAEEIARAQIALRPSVAIFGGDVPLGDQRRGRLRPDGQSSAPQHPRRRTVHKPLFEHDITPFSVQKNSGSL